MFAPKDNVDRCDVLIGSELTDHGTFSKAALWHYGITPIGKSDHIIKTILGIGWTRIKDGADTGNKAA